MPLTDEDRAALSAYLDGELDEDAAQRIEARLSLEPEVRAEYEAMRQTWGLLDYLPRAAPSSAATHRTLSRLTLEQARPPRRIARRLLAALASVIAIVAAAGLGYALGGRLPTAAPATPADPDAALIRHLGVIERWPLYQYIDDLDFARELDRPELFGDEPDVVRRRP